MGSFDDQIKAAETKAKAWVAGLSGAAGLAIGFGVGFFFHAIF